MIIEGELDGCFLSECNIFISKRVPTKGNETIHWFGKHKQCFTFIGVAELGGAKPSIQT